MQKILASVIAVAILAGCTAAQHRRAVQDDSADRLTVGKVQKEISVGMSGAEVAEVLGSPNVVSTDEQRREVWIYDKIATEATYSENTSGVYALIFWLSPSSGASSTSQRTLTVIVKFGENQLVRDFAYHSSRF